MDSEFKLGKQINLVIKSSFFPIETIIESCLFCLLMVLMVLYMFLFQPALTTVMLSMWVLVRLPSHTCRWYRMLLLACYRDKKMRTYYTHTGLSSLASCTF